MMNLVQMQIAVSTAEDESYYFVGQHSRARSRAALSPMPEGVYRVVNGELCRILPGAPLPAVGLISVTGHADGDR